MARNALWIILGFWGVALVSFWPTYFTRLAEVPRVAHFHGLLLFGWYALLLAQATLIHTGRRPAHRALGRLSFAYVPLLVLATLLAAHLTLGRGENPPEPYFLNIFAIIWLLLISFLVLYAQAIRNRRTPQAHMRYMISTGIVLLLPALSRFIGVYLQPAWFPVSDPPSVSELIAPDELGLIALQLFTLALLLNDWRRGRDARPYALCLVLLVASHALLRVVPDQPWWAAFGRWYLALPISL